MIFGEKLFFCCFIILALFSRFSPLCAQTTEFPAEVNLLTSIIIETQSEFKVEYLTDQEEVLTVNPNIEKSEEERKATPTILSIFGGSAEVFIEIENSDITLEGRQESETIKIYDFEIISNNGADGAMIRPDPKENSFLLSVGGKVSGLENEEFYTGLNIIYFNYL